MIEQIIEKLFTNYNEKGFLTNDEIFNELIASNINIVQTERICNELISKGVLITDSIPILTDNEFEFDYDRSQIDYNELYEKILKKEPGLKLLIDYIKRIKPPQMHEVEKLYPQIKSGNKFARNRLFEMNMRGVLKHAYQKAKEFHLSLEDTVQDAMIGLDLAIDRFDLSKHDKFQGYSTYWIYNSINRNKNIEETIWVFPAHFLEGQEKIYKYLRHTHNDFFSNESKITQELLTELSVFFGVPQKKIYNHLKYFLPIIDYDELKNSRDISLFDNSNEQIIDKIFGDQLNDHIDILKERERQVVKLRFGLYRETDIDFNKVVSIVNKNVYKNDGCYNYGLTLTLEEVASLYGLTRERIRQIEAKALKRLRIFCS